MKIIIIVDHLNKIIHQKEIDIYFMGNLKKKKKLKIWVLEIEIDKTIQLQKEWNISSCKLSRLKIFKIIIVT